MFKSISAIVATDENLGIGRKGCMPWPYNESDMLWFKMNTMNQVVVMGRKTWESIGSKALKERTNVVISNKNNLDSIEQPHYLMHGNIENILLELKKLYPKKSIWIIGGGDIYSQALPFVDYVYHTTIPGNYDCDVFLDEKQLKLFDQIVFTHEGQDSTKFVIRERSDRNETRI